MTRRYVLALDLKDDRNLIAEYRCYHQNVWPEVTASLKSSGIEDAEIYLLGTRMVMILAVKENFSWEAKIKADKENAIVQKWETLMSKFQQSLPQAKPGEKWVLMERIYKLQ
jgi:L-rhamnose mutarotase